MIDLMPSWLKRDMEVLWYDGSHWEKCRLSREEAGWRGSSADGAAFAVTVELSGQPKSSEGEHYTVVAKVTPGASGTIAGFQVILSADSSLQCVWKPHLAPESHMTIGDKAFRSPTIIMEDEERLCALIPDLAHLQEHRTIPHIMDYVQEDSKLSYGFCDYKESGHVYYAMTPQPHLMSRSLEVKFYLASWRKKIGSPRRDFRPVERLLWELTAMDNMRIDDTAAQWMQQLESYPLRAYEWALDSNWSDLTWQQFRIGEREAGGVVFIVAARQKPGEGKENQWREPKSIWNQAWFCSIRSAYGIRLTGVRTGKADWVDKANLMLELTLSAPQTNGLFPGYYAAGEDGDWGRGSWHLSCPRRPDGHERYVHLLDASWTCYWLLKWYRDVEQDERILPYVNRYATALLQLQREDGHYPAWVDPATLACSPYLVNSAETSAHIMLLGLLQEIDPRPGRIEAMERAASAVLNTIAAEGRWEDFETYWSCSGQWDHKRYGTRETRSGLYNQCNFGIYWTAEAMLILFRLTEERSWLDAGERILAELSLYQQIWQPAYIAVPTVGGFGVMNSDDEWNDARQSLFALTYYEFYRRTGDERYLLRSLWAMRASFYMMYCPENPEVKALYEKVHPHFDEGDYGFHMENFNHHDGTEVGGLGEFTIFDWGCGAAASSWAELRELVERTTG